MYGIFFCFQESIRSISFVPEFFGELIVTWNAMSYLTAIKDYKGILISFITAVAVSLLVGFLLILIGIPHVERLMIAVTIGYGIMLLWDVTLLYRLFSAERDQCIFLFTLGGSFLPLAFTACSRTSTICTSCYHVVRTDPCTCSGIILWCTVS